eukprot:scaffold24871_cov31-Tisochrysis_lutea.AAC.3
MQRQVRDWRSCRSQRTNTASCAVAPTEEPSHRPSPRRASRSAMTRIFAALAGRSSTLQRCAPLAGRQSTCWTRSHRRKRGGLVAIVSSCRATMAHRMAEQCELRRIVAVKSRRSKAACR